MCLALILLYYITFLMTKLTVSPASPFIRRFRGSSPDPRRIGDRARARPRGGAGGVTGSRIVLTRIFCIWCTSFHIIYLVVYRTVVRNPLPDNVTRSTTSLMVHSNEKRECVCVSLSTCTSSQLWKGHACPTVSALKEQLPPNIDARRSSSALAPSCPKQGRRPPPC